MRSETPDENRINAVLRQLTRKRAEFWMPAMSMMNRAILLLALASVKCAILALDGKKAGQLF